MDTNIIALSQTAARKFRSAEPYVIVSIRSIGCKRLTFYHGPNLWAHMHVFFDDVTPDECTNAAGAKIWFEMLPEHAERIVSFVSKWWGKVATIVIHCEAGISRSTAVAASIAAHHGQTVAPSTRRRATRMHTSIRS